MDRLIRSVYRPILFCLFHLTYTLRELKWKLGFVLFFEYAF